MSQELYARLNEQMNFEYEAAYIYNVMCAYCAEQNLNGAAHWLRVQVDEEIYHAEKIRNFLFDRGYETSFTGLDPVEKDYTSLLDVFQKALEHEKLISASIRKLYKEAVEKDEFEAQVMLNWFIQEQVEEEATFGEIVEILEQVCDSSAATFMYDSKLMQRPQFQIVEFE